MKLYLSIAVGGFIGAISRYSASQWLPWEGIILPIGTLTINLIGCYVLSFLIHLPTFQKRWPLYVRTGITTGFIGSFTTFSTFSVESLQLLQQQRGAWTVGYILLSIAGGYIFVHLGYLSAKRTNRGWERGNQS